MGSKVSPTFANLFMENFENKWVYTYPLQPLVWYRYIDDIFAIWTHSENELKQFIEHLNNVHTTIKFTAEYSKSHLNFLDTTVKKDTDDTLYTTLYTKPTDTHTYLHYTSAHPTHQKRSGPYSQLVRVRRICKKQEDFLLNSKKILQYYKQRGYPSHLLDEALDKAKQLDRKILLIPKDPDTTQSQSPDELIMVVTYNPANPDVKNILDNNWNIINGSKNLKPITQQKDNLGTTKTSKSQKQTGQSKTTTNAHKSRDFWQKSSSMCIHKKHHMHILSKNKYKWDSEKHHNKKNIPHS